jgi:hypothetical protein
MAIKELQGGSHPDYTYEQFTKDVGQKYGSNTFTTGGQLASIAYGTRDMYLRELKNLGLLKNDPVSNLLSSMGEGTAQASGAFKEALDTLKAQLPGYSKSAAFADAKALMDETAAKSLEANKPAIQRAVEGAGTSASSMAGLLSTKLATDTARAAAAQGAEQAKAYGAISAQLSSAISNMAASGDPVQKMLASLAQAQIAADAQTTSAGIGASASMANARTAANAQLEAAQMQADVARENNLLDYQEGLYKADAGTYAANVDALVRAGANDMGFSANGRNATLTGKPSDSRYR